jgi:hypothetical protein
MARLLVHVEGQTEETFVNEILRDHLVNRGFESVSARLIGNARLRTRRGGIRPWSTVKKEIINHLRQDRGCIVTTMVDFYGLPQHKGPAWPGREKAATLGSTAARAKCVETALLGEVVDEIASHPVRFVPFVVMHEFEGLLFSDCKAFAEGICRPDLQASFRKIREDFTGPEDIDDSTPPSKHVEKLVSGYEKPLLGTLAVLEIGLERICAQCPHFRDWIDQLEAVAGKGQRTGL